MFRVVAVSVTVHQTTARDLRKRVGAHVGVVEHWREEQIRTRDVISQVRGRNLSNTIARGRFGSAAEMNDYRVPALWRLAEFEKCLRFHDSAVEWERALVGESEERKEIGKKDNHTP